MSASDDNGLGGLEQKFEPQLHGVPGRMYTAMDARRQVMGSSEHEPEPGQNLVLTIDENIQFLAERALDHAMQRTRAANGTVVVQDVHTGQILALAVRPTFNPNVSRRTTPDLLRNHAVSDVYEPGSTFKLVTYSAALEQHAATPDDIDRLPGRSDHPGRPRDSRRQERPRAGQNHGGPGAGQIQRRGRRQTGAQGRPGPLLSSIVRDFGFGARTGAEMPGETRGLLRPVNKWSPSSIGSIAIGQEIGVTPLQLVSMVSTIANGGVYLPPHVLMPGQVESKWPKALPRRWRRRPSSRAAICPTRFPRRAPRALHHDRGPDAQDDGGRGALRHRQEGAAQRLLLRRQDRHRAKDRSGHRPATPRPCTSPRSPALRRSTIR